MLYLLDKDVRTVKWNGIPLHEASSAIVKEETNGDFYITVRYPITDSSIYQLIKEDMLIKAPVPVLGAQLFRIKKPVENDDSLDITAYHITDDVMQRSINPLSVVGQGCAMALSQMVQNAKTDLGTFSFTSDIMDSRTFNTTETETLYTVLMDGKHSIVGTWEGELVRDNFALTIKRSRGADRGVVITTHKNLKSYQRTKNSQSVVTRIHAKSTFKAEGAEEETTINVTVDSPLIGNYPYINEKDYENNNAKTVDELRKWAEAKFKNEGIDKISDAIEIEAYELDGQVIHLGDTVNIKSRKHDVDLYKKAIAYEYNALTEEYISITFDDKPGVGGAGVSSGVSNAADVILGVNANAQEVAIERAVRNANQAFDAEFEKRVEVINDGIKQAQAEAERYADAIKQEIDTEIVQVNQSMQTQAQEHDRQVADILSKTQSVESLANQAKSDAASALARANQVKTEAIADARAQVATVSQALNTAKTELQTAIASADQKARDSQASATVLRNDLNLQASKILEQARAQTALTSRVTSVETLADGTRSTVAELSRTMQEATQNIASVTSRTRTVEDTLSQTRTQYEALTQTVNTQTGQIDSINRKTADLQSGINGMTERFENLRVGGINLLTDTDEETVYISKNPAAMEFLRSPYDLAKVFDKHGLVTYTLSLDLKAEKDGAVRVYMQNGSGSRYGGLYTYIGVTTEWKRYHVTFTPTEGNMELSESFLAFYGVYGTGVVPYARKFKLEKGTVPTDWSPATEDLRSEIATYKRSAEESSTELSRQIQLADGKAVDAKTYAQQTAEGIKTRLESLETYKNAEGARAEQYLTASREETARQLTAERTAIATNYVAKSTYDENVRGTALKLNEIKTTADTAKQNLATYQNTVDGKLEELTSSTQTLDGKINTASTKITQNANEISKRLTSTQVDKAITDKGYQTKSDVDNNITGRGYITSSALQPYALSTTVQNLVQETADSFSRTISETKALIPTETGGRNYIFESRTAWINTNNSQTCPISKEQLKDGSREFIRIRRSNPSLNPSLMSLYTSITGFSSEIPTSGKGKISFKARASTPVNMNVMGILISSTSTNLPWNGSRISIGTEWQTYSFDFEFVKGMTTLRANPLLVLPPVPNLADFYLDLCEWQLEAGTIASSWSPAPEDLATVTALHDVKYTVSSHTRTIGAVGTAGSILDNVSKVTQTAAGLVQEVSGTNGLKTQVSTLAGSYAIKNLTSAGTVLNQLNLNKDGSVKIDGKLVQITGTTYIQDGVIASAKIAGLDAGKITSGYLASGRIKADSIDGSKLVFDQAFVNKMTANEALFKQLFAKSAFITSVQAVTLSASKISGGLLTSLNGATTFNLNDGKLTFNSTSPSIEFNSSQSAIRRVSGNQSQFLKFAYTNGATYTTIGANRRANDESIGTADFTGFQIQSRSTASGGLIDKIYAYADEFTIAGGGGQYDGIVFKNRQYLYPQLSGVLDLGRSDKRWDNVYAFNYYVGQNAVSLRAFLDAVRACFQQIAYGGMTQTTYDLLKNKLNTTLNKI
ncbi:phage tail spike protein [Streptococcus suis]|uniref:phage tail spike protein n=1 Tax=Streptococcus suis TaxID=1307 RepID=UPI001C98AB3A|nr:phage tail spike protein [Streptococcus suis]MBY5032506.1 hypothetical protein [Streptococcus suis]MBY5037012.1 hypothetical protein [Streptococcus suis]